MAVEGLKTYLQVLCKHCRALEFNKRPPDLVLNVMAQSCNHSCKPRQGWDHHLPPAQCIVFTQQMLRQATTSAVAPASLPLHVLIHMGCSAGQLTYPDLSTAL